MFRLSGECWNLDGHMYVVVETYLHPQSMPVAERSRGTIKHIYQ